MRSSPQSETVRGELLEWDFQMDAWILLMLPNGRFMPSNYSLSGLPKAGITAEKLFQRGMPQDAISPHACSRVSNCMCR